MIHTLIHALLTVAALVMGMRMAFHLVCAHALVIKSGKWSPNMMWHLHLTASAALIAGAFLS